MTFASSIEAFAKMLVPDSAKRDDADSAGIESLVGHINAWSGSGHLKKVAISALHRTAEITTVHALRQLRNAGVVTAEQFSAWGKVRNAVMHGSLLSPYSNEEEDAQLLALCGMMHNVTREVVRHSSSRLPHAC
jgi:hypothetical protein